MAAARDIDHHRQKNVDPMPDYVMGDISVKNEDIFYAGIIPGVPVEVDVTNRTDVLRIIDIGKKNELIPLQVTQEDEAIFTISSIDIQISRQDPDKDLLLLVPINEIAAICYIKDDGHHILAIKYGNPEKCDLAVLYCQSQIQADTICESLGQCFQLAYQEATMQLLLQTIKQASKSQNSLASSSDSGTIHNRQAEHSFLTKSDSSLHDNRTPSVGKESETSSSHHALLVKEYLKELPKIFAYEELTKFSTLFQALNDPMNTDITDICDDIYKLYGPSRRHLIKGLCPFIHSKHYQYFEKFLKEKGLDVSENLHSTLSSSHSFNRMYTRSQSDVSTTNASDISTMNTSDFDHVLERLSVELEKMEASVGDVSNPYINNDT